MILDMLVRIEPAARFFVLDTGVLFEETYDTWRRVEARYGITIERYAGEWVDGLWATDPDACCGMRKVRPLERALEGADAWITGLRRDQTPARAGTPKLAWDDAHGKWKAAPLADWTDKDVWRYIAATTSPTTRCTTAASRRSAARTAPSRAPAARAAGPARTGSSAASTSRPPRHEHSHRRAHPPPGAGGGGDPHHARGRRRAREPRAAVLRRQGLDRAAAPGREGLPARAVPVPDHARGHGPQLPRGDRVPRPPRRRARASG